MNDNWYDEYMFEIIAPVSYCLKNSKIIATIFEVAHIITVSWEDERAFRPRGMVEGESFPGHAS